MQSSTKIAFIGGGNMARSIIGGLIHSGWAPSELFAADPELAQRQQLTQQFGLTCFDDNAQCALHGETIVLAVKPQSMQQAVHSIATVAQQQKPLLISIAPGLRCAEVLRWAGGMLPLVRAMPNTPARVNAGMCALFATTTVQETQRQLAQRIMQSVGETLWVQSEALLDVVTGVSGSGPAYFFKLMEQMVNSAMQHGLDQESAHQLVVQTAVGAAHLAQHSPQSAAELRRQVTSPGGTTEAALCTMEAHGLDAALQQGIAAAITRCQQLAEQFASPPYHPPQDS